MPMRTIVFRILVACMALVELCTSQIRPTAAVRGRITDDSTHAPLAAVNVFIAGTTIFTASDSNGTYLLKRIPFGSHNLVVSLVGYETATHMLRLTGSGEQRLDVRLKPRVISVPGVEITERFDASWKDHLEEFSREFLGSSLNARSCRILNPEVLDFRIDPVSGALTASASRPLSVENDALGYRIMAVLDDFERSSESIRYSTHLRFEKMNPSGEQTDVVWKRNRLLAYRCSLRFFLFSVIHSGCAANGFIVEKSDGPSWPGTSQPGMNRPDLISVSGDTLRGYEWEINFPGTLRVTYRNERESDEFTAFRRSNGDQISLGLDHQTSWIEMKATQAAIDANGNLIYPYAIKTFGYWAFQRIADTLPEDYDPNESD